MVPMRVRTAVVTFDHEKFEQVLDAYRSCIGTGRLAELHAHFPVTIDGEKYDGVIATTFFDYVGKLTEVLVLGDIDDRSVEHFIVLVRNSDDTDVTWIAKQERQSGGSGCMPVIGSYASVEVEPPTH